MLPLLILTLLMMLPCFASKSEIVSLNKLSKEAEKATRLHKDEVLAIQKKATEQFSKKPGQCLVHAPCFNSSNKSEQERPSSELSLLTDKSPIIFISGSMPKAALKLLVSQAKHHNASFVIRGMVNGSIGETATFSKELGVPLDIDPKLFSTFNIQKVPVFLIHHQGKWHKVSGNVDLSYVLSRVRMSEKTP